MSKFLDRFNPVVQDCELNSSGGTPVSPNAALRWFALSCPNSRKSQSRLSSRATEHDSHANLSSSGALRTRSRALSSARLASGICNLVAERPRRSIGVVSSMASYSDRQACSGKRIPAMQSQAAIIVRNNIRRPALYSALPSNRSRVDLSSYINEAISF